MDHRRPPVAPAVPAVPVSPDHNRAVAAMAGVRVAVSPMEVSPMVATQAPVK